MKSLQIQISNNDAVHLTLQGQGENTQGTDKIKGYN